MDFTPHVRLNLNRLGDASDLPGHDDGRLYTAHTLVTTADRGFMHLSSMNNDNPLKTDYFIYEVGGSDINVAINKDGKREDAQLKNFKTEYLEGMRENGIRASRLTPMDPKDHETAENDPSKDDTFETAVEGLLGLSSGAPLAAKIAKIRSAPAHNA